MERITSQDQAEVIGYVLDLIPERLRDAAGCDFVTVDPVFAGLHDIEDTGDYLSDGLVRSYRTTAHCCYPCHVADKRSTVVLPPRRDERPHSYFTVLHEIGHALQHELGERIGGYDRLPHFNPVSEYAAANQDEAFAEAFAAWFYEPEQIPAFDPASRAFFDGLAA